MKTFFSTVVLALTLAAPAAAAAVKVGDLTIENPWARATPQGAEVGAAYLTIKNDGATADRLTGVSSQTATVRVHEMKLSNGVMEMREISGGLEIPAHRSVALAPGGQHLMFTALKQPFVKGQTVAATLTFERAGQVTVDFPVLGVGAPGPGGAMSHDMKGMKM